MDHGVILTQVALSESELSSHSATRSYTHTKDAQKIR